MYLVVVLYQLFFILYKSPGYNITAIICKYFEFVFGKIKIYYYFIVKTWTTSIINFLFGADEVESEMKLLLILIKIVKVSIQRKTVCKKYSTFLGYSPVDLP